MVKYSEKQIIEIIETNFTDKTVFILAPVVKGEKVIIGSCFQQQKKDS